MLGQWVAYGFMALIGSIGFAFLVAKHVRVATRHPYGWRRLSDAEITTDLERRSEEYLSRGDPAGTTYLLNPVRHDGLFLAIVQQHHTGSRVRGISLFARPWRDVQ